MGPSLSVVRCPEAGAALQEVNKCHAHHMALLLDKAISTGLIV
jgi:hypothetical protein